MNDERLGLSFITQLFWLLIHHSSFRIQHSSYEARLSVLRLMVARVDGNPDDLLRGRGR